MRHLESLPGYRDQIAHVEELPARPARFASPEEPVHPALAETLRRRGIHKLYAHQAEAIRALRQGSNVAVSTSTASGKTLCYNIPALESCLADRRSRCLYVFPTKALAQDQMRVLRELSQDALPSLKVGTFDGDTPQNRRAELRRSASIILTNPDMLSMGILPNHTSWAPFFAHLRYVVIDEAHAYRGIFGSHVANILRRLDRVCRLHGSKPRFIFCSATVANAGDHIGRLLGRPVQVIDQDGAPHGPRQFALWNPPVIDELGSRRSAGAEATMLFVELVKAGIRNITFTKSRKTAELIFMQAREVLRREAPELVPLIAAYRAGYLAEDRRSIEQGLFSGRLLGVASTTALELGVDVGRLDATVLTGYPGTLASTWQQAGRAGRGLHDALSVLIGMADPLDQYLMRHPEEIFARPVENALIDPVNPYILPLHLLCAAYEAPLTAADEESFGGPAVVRPALEQMQQEGLISSAGGRWFYAGAGYPAQEVSIRSISGQHYSILDRSNGLALLETIEPALAFLQAHPGAVYLHQGDTYLVDSLDLNGRTVYARPVEVGYYTQPVDHTEVRIVRTRLGGTSGESAKDAATPAPAEPSRTAAYWGDVRVTTQVVGFRRKQRGSESVVSVEPLDLPPLSYETRSLWFDIPEAAVAEVQRRGLDLAGGLHALEHAAIAILPLYAMCDRNDIGGLSTSMHPDTGRAQVFIYDALPGGVGISEKGYQILPDLWRATLQLLRECPCDEGCPSCVQSPKCGNNNQPLDKQAAAVILDALVEPAGDPAAAGRLPHPPDPLPREGRGSPVGLPSPGGRGAGGEVVPGREGGGALTFRGRGRGQGRRGVFRSGPALVGRGAGARAGLLGQPPALHLDRV